MGQHVMEEVFDSSLTANHWSDAAGGRPQFGEMHIEPEEIVPPEAITAFTPEEDYTGYTGNEGTPLERWYRRAAIVVWPNDRHFAVLCDCGAANALQSPDRDGRQVKEAPAVEAAAMLEQCRTFARGILAAWRSRDKSKDYMRTPASLDLLKAIGPLNDPRLLASYVTDALASDAALVPGVDRGQKAGQYRGRGRVVEVVPDEEFLQLMMQRRSLLSTVTRWRSSSSSAHDRRDTISR